MKPLTAASPHAIVMVGIPGAGKSTFAERFADTYRAPILNRIKLQKDLQLDNEQVDILAEIMLREFIKSQKTLIIEGGTDTLEERAALIKFLMKEGYRPLLVWVQTDTSEALRRATKPYPGGSGLSADDFDAILEHFQSPTEKEKPLVISGKHTYGTQLKAVLKQIALNVRSVSVQPASDHPRSRGISLR